MPSSAIMPPLLSSTHNLATQSKDSLRARVGSSTAKRVKSQQDKNSTAPKRLGSDEAPQPDFVTAPSEISLEFSLRRVQDWLNDTFLWDGSPTPEQLEKTWPYPPEHSDGGCDKCFGLLSERRCVKSQTEKYLERLAMAGHPPLDKLVAKFKLLCSRKVDPEEEPIPANAKDDDDGGGRLIIQLRATPVWYCLNIDGVWTPYGNATGNVEVEVDIVSASAPIEKHYQESPSKLFALQTSEQKYQLDFAKMLQTNVATGTVRPMWRKVHMEANNIEWNYKTLDGTWHSIENLDHGSEALRKDLSDKVEKEAAANAKGCCIVDPELHYRLTFCFEKSLVTDWQTYTVYPIRRMFVIPTQSTEKRGIGMEDQPTSWRFAWAFQDGRGRWNNFRGTMENVLTDGYYGGLSRDIEKSFCSYPYEKMEVTFNYEKYLIDFKAMTYTHKENQVSRLVQCIKHYTCADITTELGPTLKTYFQPDVWTPMPENTTLVFASVNYFCEDFSPVRELIIRSLPHYYIVEMERIQNPFLYKAYQNKKEYLESQRRNKVTESMLFHGTPERNLNTICEQNLDWRLYGNYTTKHLFGQGAYFSNKAAMSLLYCGPPPPSQQSTLLVFQVLVGDCVVGNSELRRPPVNPNTGRLFDTTVNHLHTPTIFVKYDSQEYYPKYLVVVRSEDSMTE